MSQTNKVMQSEGDDALASFHRLCLLWPSSTIICYTSFHLNRTMEACDSLLRDEIVYILLNCLCNSKRNFKRVMFTSYAIDICRVRSLLR